MNNKYYLLTMLLLGGMAIPSILIHAKTVTAPSVTSQPKNNNAAASTSGENEDGVSYPTINQITFSGNTVIASDVLKKAIPLKVKDVANQYVIMDSMVKIAQLYKEKNIKVTIAPVLEKVSNNTTNIQFDIHEISLKKE